MVPEVELALVLLLALLEELVLPPAPPVPELLALVPLLVLALVELELAVAPPVPLAPLDPVVEAPPWSPVPVPVPATLTPPLQAPASPTTRPRAARIDRRRSM
jgi:hypothetical protein